VHSVNNNWVGEYQKTAQILQTSDSFEKGTLKAKSFEQEMISVKRTNLKSK